MAGCSNQNVQRCTDPSHACSRAQVLSTAYWRYPHDLPKERLYVVEIAGSVPLYLVLYATTRYAGPNNKTRALASPHLPSSSGSGGTG